MDTGQYTLSVEIPYGLTIVSSPNYDHDYCFKVGNTVISGKVMIRDFCGRYEEFYKNCKKSGVEKGWYYNWNKWYEHNYKDGKLEGLSIRWDINGSRCYEYNYKNGKREGLALEWYEDGSKRAERNYKNDKLNGLSICWLDDDQYGVRREVYKDGNLVRTTKTYL